MRAAYARMAQEHDLCNSAARRPGCEEREEIIAKDHLYRLVQCDFFVGNLDEMHEAAAVEEHPETDGEERQQQRPRMKTRQIVERIDVHGRVDDRSRDTNNKHQKKKEAPRKFAHALRSPLSPTRSNTLHAPQRHCGCGWTPHSRIPVRNMQAPAGHAARGRYRAGCPQRISDSHMPPR
mgnify:CR=1 FL=1